MLSTTIVVTIVVIAISLLFLRQASAVIEENYINTLWSTLSVALNAFDEKVMAAYNIITSIEHDQKLIADAKAYEEKQASAPDAMDIADYLSGYQQKADTLDSIYLYLPGRKQLITSINFRYLMEVFYPDQHSWITAAPQTSAGFSPSLVYDRINRAPKYILTFARPLKDAPDSAAAIASVNIDENLLRYKCLASLGRSSFVRYYIADGAGRIAVASSVNEVGLNITDIYPMCADIIASADQKTYQNGDDDLLAASVRSSFSNYRIICISNRAELTASLMQQRSFVLGILALALVVSIGFSYQISAQIYRPIKHLYLAMQDLSNGNLEASAKIYAKDEIGQLSIGFNQMVVRIRELLDKLIREQSEKKEAELEALQYQITPHFMYNTLNSIKCASYVKNVPEIGEQVAAFIELLHASINNKAMFITVREEISLVQEYVKIELFHYPDSLDVQYALDERAQDLYIPRMILQPLVENAIIHGQDRRKGRYHIKVTTSLKGDRLEMVVEDDGRGMNQEQMDHLMREDDASRAKISKIGIPNIMQRLQLYYAAGASLVYSSAVGVGTKATIVLPATHDADRYAI